MYWPTFAFLGISIHAPLRERPYGPFLMEVLIYFNPRSLAGATWSYQQSNAHQLISIHAPLRERPIVSKDKSTRHTISIHAPLRERPGFSFFRRNSSSFQSTLPCGSDEIAKMLGVEIGDFNPRSLAGATAA